MKYCDISLYQYFGTPLISSVSLNIVYNNDRHIIEEPFGTFNRILQQTNLILNAPVWQLIYKHGIFRNKTLQNES